MLLSTVTAGIKHERGFLARESSDEDVVSTVACAVETTIDASAVFCVVTHEEHCQNGRHCRFPTSDDRIIFGSDSYNFTATVDVPSIQYD